MCTLTVVPGLRVASPAWTSDPLLLRVACNRDELRTRSDALPPAVQTVDGQRVVMPLDPESDGCWIAANEHGLVFSLLNVNQAGVPAEGLSRGAVIPRIAGAASAGEALERMLGMEAGRYRPFRLLILDGSQLVECWLDGGRLRHRRAYLQDAVMRTSSSLGDSVVEGPRRTLFRRFFSGAPHSAAAQEAFHEHQWPGREDVSVRMERRDALTVSRTIVEVTTRFATMIYRATRDDTHARVVLPLAGRRDMVRSQCS